MVKATRNYKEIRIYFGVRKSVRYGDVFVNVKTLLSDFCPKAGNF